MMAFFGPGVGKIYVKTFHRVLWYEIGEKLSGLGTDYPYIGQAPSADTVNSIAVIFVSPLDTEEVDFRPLPGLVEQKNSLAGADFDMNRTGTSENPDKIDSVI